MDTELGPFRCAHCGNKTRFDVYERVRRRRFAHFDLAGDLVIEEEEPVELVVERIVCRWCDRDDGIEGPQPPSRRRSAS